MSRPTERVVEHDDMGRTVESLLAWMRDVAVARDDHARKHRTVNLKFTTATLRMWLQRVDDAVGLKSPKAVARNRAITERERLDHVLDEWLEVTHDPETGERRITQFRGPLRKWFSIPLRELIDAEIEALLCGEDFWPESDDETSGASPRGTEPR